MVRLALIVIVLMLAPAGCGSLIVTQQSVESLAGRRGFAWQTHEREGFVIYVEPATVAAEQIDAIASEAREARRQVLAYLEEPPYEPIVSIFVVDSRDRMKDLIGRPSNATAYYTSNSLCLVWTDTWRGGATHELLHVLAMNQWGVAERWVNEGMAVDAAGPWQGLDVHAVCKHLRTRDELPSLNDITRRFNQLPGVVSYPAAGSFVRYVREAYGLDTLRMVWDGGRRELPAATGMALDDLETAWHEVLEQADARGIEYGVRVFDGDR